ncbi:MAG: calcium/sodium antiporter [Phycisphaeraceae bacterium]
MSAMTLVLFVAGLGLLVVGAELLVRGASKLAAAAGISPLVVGLTVVAFGTSAPELAVSLGAAFNGQADIAIGNVVGSNIFNVLFILGISALIVPLVVNVQLIRIDVPLMIGASVLMWILSLDGSLNRVDGLILFAGIVVYMIMAIRAGRKESKAAQQAADASSEAKASAGGKAMAMNVALIIAGLALLVLGASWFVGGAVEMAHAMGLSEVVIGLTIVAAGTSMPEVAASVMASIKGQRDIAVGNVVGSNLFNILGILGITAIASPTSIEVKDAVLAVDIPIMTAVALACLPIFFTGHVIARWEGAVFLLYYIAYTAYLILAATHHDALHGFSVVMVYFALPITAMTLGVIAWRAMRKRGA